MDQELEKIDDAALYEHVIDQIFSLVEKEQRGNEFQKAIVGQHVASGLIGNRGLYDQDQEDVACWIRSYEVLGAEEIARVLREASPLIRSVDTEDEPDEDDEEKLEALEEAYYELDEKLQASLGKIIRQNLAVALAVD